jgi:hypothetical protein
VFLIGYPCSGKTFMADYLETIGWYNVDGDWVFMSKKPEDQKLKGDLMAALKKIIHNEAVTEAEKSVLKGYYKGLCDKAIASANQGTNTAISFVLYTRWLRDYVRSLFHNFQPKGSGVPDINIIHVKVDIKILLPRNRIRMEKGASQHNMTLEKAWDMKMTEREKKLYGQEYSHENFDKYMVGEYYTGF